MKFMTFNRSCAYTGIANLLEEFDIHYEDYEIIKELSIPYMFLYLPQEKCYIAGAMIQSDQWFNYFLNSLGLKFIEKHFIPESAIKRFNGRKKRYIIGINLNEIDSKHAVIYEGKENKKYHFLNPKRKDSIEQDYFIFNKEELIQKLPSDFKMGYLIKIKKVIYSDLSEQLQISLQNIDYYCNDLIKYCSKKQSINSLNKSKDKLFAPLLLDVLAMMEIIEETALVENIQNIRINYIKAIKENKSIILTDYIKIDYLKETILNYKHIISKYLIKYKEIINEKYAATSPNKR